MISPLFKKKALDALLDSMAVGLGRDNYDDMGAHRRGESTPEMKGTEFNDMNGEGFAGSAVVIPSKDVAAPPDPANAEFFKEAPEFEMSASGVRRIIAKGTSPEWESIHNFLIGRGWNWLGRVTDGTEMWGKFPAQLVYNPATMTWIHRVNGVVNAEGSLDDLETKIPKTSALKSCVACECGGCIAHDKFAGDLVSYGMGQPLGGTDNPTGGDDDENADEDQNADLGGMNMTSALKKVASMTSVAWWAKSARPTEEKIQLLQKQLNITPEMIELCINADPSPQQKDFVATIAKWFAKKLINLPEDTAKLKEQLGLFQKLKKSPKFKGNKDIQGYDPAGLFKTVEENQQNISEKEKKRRVVKEGATLIIDEGDLTIYKVTDPTALSELSGGTNWCTAHLNHGSRYLKTGPSYVMFKNDSAFAQLHPSSDQFMDRQDVCMVSEMDDSMGQTIAKIVEDPTAMRGLQLLSAKEPEVAEWVKENATEPGTVEEILGRKRDEEQAQGGQNREMTVRHAIQTNTPLPEDQEIHLSNQNVDLDLLYKYGTKFHAGQPWFPLEQAVFQDDDAGYIVNYIEEFRGQRWPAGERRILDIAFGNQNKNYNEAGVNAMLMYAERVIKGRWPEVETYFHTAPATPTNGKASAEYAIRILQHRWPQIPGNDPAAPIHEENIIHANPKWMNEYSKKFMPEQLWDRFRDVMMDRAGLDESGYNEEQGFWLVRQYDDLAEFVNGSGDSHAQDAMDYALDSEAEGPNNADIPDMDDMAAEIAKNLSYTAMKRIAASLQGELPDLVQRWQQANSLTEFDYTSKVQMESILVYIGRYAPECSVWQNIRRAFEEGAQAHYKSRRIGDLEYALDSDMYERGEDSHGRPIFTELRYGPDYKTRFGGNWRIAPVLEVLDREGAYRMLQDYADDEKTDLDISRGQLELYMMEPDDSDSENNEESFELMDRWYTKGTPQKKDPNQMQLQFQSSLLKKKKALVQMHETPTMLPPRTDIRRHIDQTEQDAINADVREGLHDATPNTMKPSIGQIDPRINPLGIQSSVIDDLDRAIPGGKRIGPRTEPSDPNYYKPCSALNVQRTKDGWKCPDCGAFAAKGQVLTHRKRKEAGMTEQEMLALQPGDVLLYDDGRPGHHAEADVLDWIRPGMVRVQFRDRARPDTIGTTTTEWTNHLTKVSSKTADYDQQQDEADEYFLDQVQDAKNVAKEHFMNEDYIKQLCDDFVPPKTMEEMWKEMGDEWTAEFYGMPYQRVPDFTDQETPQKEQTELANAADGDQPRFASCPACKTASLKTLTDEAKGYKSSMILAECSNCQGFYSLSSNK